MNRLLIRVTMLFCIITATVQTSNNYELLKQIQLWDEIMRNDNQLNANYEEAMVPHYEDYGIAENDGNIKYLYPRPTSQRDAETLTQDSANRLLDRKIQIVNDNPAPFHRYDCRKFENLISNPTCRSSYCRFNSNSNSKRSREEDHLLRALCSAPGNDAITNYFGDDIRDNSNPSLRNKMKSKQRNDRNKSYITNKKAQNNKKYPPQHVMSDHHKRGEKNSVQKHKVGGKNKKSKEQIMSEFTTNLFETLTMIIKSIEKECQDEINKAKSVENFLNKAIKNGTRIVPHREPNNNIYIPMDLYKALAIKNVKAEPYSPPKHTNRLKKKQIHRRSDDQHKTNYGLPFQLQVQGLGQAVYTKDAE